MASKRGDQKPWMEAPAYGRSLRGFQVNLLVKDVARSVTFAREVLEASVIYADADFAVLRHGAGPEWMLHADHTYGSHPLLGLTGDGALRGAGVELRLHDHDPDKAAKKAASLGYTFLPKPPTNPMACGNPTSSIPTAMSGFPIGPCRHRQRLAGPTSAVLQSAGGGAMPASKSRQHGATGFHAANERAPPGALS